MRLHPLLTCLILGALPAAAALMGNIETGSKKKDVLKAAATCGDLKAKKPKAARSKLEGTYTLNAEPGFQQWATEFVFDRKSKELTSLLFVGSIKIPDKEYTGYLRSFYLFTHNALTKHFGVENPMNLPNYARGKDTKPGDFYPLHAYVWKEQALLTIGLHRNSDRSFSIAFRLTTYTRTAMGSTSTENTDGDQSEWQQIPHLDNWPMGKDFLVQNGLVKPEPEPDVNQPLDTGLVDGSSPAASDNEAETTGTPAEVATTTTTPQPTVPAHPKPATIPADAPLTKEERALLMAINYLAVNWQAETAVRNLQTLATNGDSRAMYELALCYEQGKGVEKNPTEAAKLLQQAAYRGFALAMVRYGEEYPAACSSLNLKQEQADALINSLTSAAMDGNSVSARFNYAIMLRYGYGIRKNIFLARDLLEDLASRGDAQAADMLNTSF